MRKLDAAPLFPSTLYRRDGVPLWYLDLKDWIGLAKARLGQPGGDRYEGLLAALIRGRATRSMRIVLSNPPVAGDLFNQ